MCHIFTNALLVFDTSVFDASLPTTSCIIRGQTVEERAEALAKSGKVASAGNVWRFLGSMMYNSEEMLLARKIAREIRANERRERESAQADAETALLEKAEGVYQTFREKGSVLTALSAEDLKHLVRFVCHIKKKKGDTFSKHSGSKKKMQERLAAVEPSWTKYFVEDEEGDAGAANHDSAGATGASAEESDGGNGAGDSASNGGPENDVIAADAEC